MGSGKRSRSGCKDAFGTWGCLSRPDRRPSEDNNISGRCAGTGGGSASVFLERESVNLNRESPIDDQEAL